MQQRCTATNLIGSFAQISIYHIIMKGFVNYPLTPGSALPEKAQPAPSLSRGKDDVINYVMSSYAG
jgi:hypothetical protein